jgi:hypothetical protein
MVGRPGIVVAGEAHCARSAVLGGRAEYTHVTSATEMIVSSSHEPNLAREPGCHWSA